MRIRKWYAREEADPGPACTLTAPTQHNAFYQKIIADREKVYSDKAKAKSKYDEHCHELDSHRQKREKAEAGDKNAERARKGYEAAEAEMWNAKVSCAQRGRHELSIGTDIPMSSSTFMRHTQNVYLVSIAASNRAKERFYQIDLPRLQDDLQSLWTLADRQLVVHVSRASEELAKHSEGVAAKHRKLQSDASLVDVASDQALFVDYNRRRFDEPVDFAFEPCVGFFDKAEMSVEEPAKVFLQNMLIRKHKQISETQPIVESKGKEIQGLENLRDAYLNDTKLGNPEEVMDNLLESIRSAMVLEAQVSVLDAEVDAVAAAIGDDVSSARPHLFKSQAFTIPATCNFCEGKIFGMNRHGFVCKPCGYTCHAKCEPKVPAQCRASPAQRQQSAGSSTTSSLDRRISTSGTSILSRTNTVRTSASGSSGASAGAGAGASLNRTASRRAAPPPPGRRTAAGSAASAPASAGPSGPKAEALYAYDAGSGQELSITAGEELVVLEDVGSGWLRASNARGGVGLVPATYVRVDAGAGAEDDVDEEEEEEEEAGRVRALYDYAAQEDNELSLSEGEEVRLTATGFDFGAGWCEGVRNGKVGVFPANYVERL